MALVGSYVKDEHWPDYGTLVVRDSGWAAEPDDGWDVRLDEHAERGPSVSGGLALAGNGWVRAAANDEYARVELELHDGPPADSELPPGGGERSVVEMPYRSIGTVGVGMLVDGGAAPQLQLGPPGTYRVRVTRLRDAPGVDGDVWRLAFWPAPVQAPRWLELTRPGPPSADSLWRNHLPDAALEVLGLLSNADPDAVGTTLEQAVAARGRDAEWLDQPVLAPVGNTLPTGHPEVDEAERLGRQEYVEYELRTWRALVGPLGVPVPERQRDLLGVLEAAGLVIRRGNQVVVDPHPRFPDQVLALTPEARERDRQNLAMLQHSVLVTDLLHVALWAPGGVHREPLSALGERLQADREAVRGALDYGVNAELLVVGHEGADVLLSAPPVEVDPPDADDWQPFQRWPAPDAPGSDHGGDVAGAWPAPRPVTPMPFVEVPFAAVPPPLSGPPPPPPVPGDGGPLGAPPRAEPPTPGQVPQDVERVTYTAHAFVVSDGPAGQPEPARFPTGAPPRHGIVQQDGAIVRWGADGLPQTERRGPAGATRALQTPYGVVVVATNVTVLVPPDGPVVDLGPLWQVGVNAEGSLFVGVENQFGRRNRFVLHLVDLRDGSRSTMPWDENRWLTGPLTFDGETVLLSGEVPGHEADGLASPLRWLPGSEPASDPSRRPGSLAAANGVIGTGGPDGVTVRWSDGLERVYGVDSSASLTPGGDHLAWWRYDPPAMTLWEVTRHGPTPEPRVLWLPPQTEIPGPARPCVWEDRQTVVLHSRSYGGAGDAVRLNLTSGHSELVSVETMEGAGQPYVFIEPLLGAAGP
ncbi:MAG TPA: hypothetical protein VFR07_07270 [Mycobacteriales bacterium]|nr:hypothetical protein [Mycobacteriales bacterium]